MRLPRLDWLLLAIAVATGFVLSLFMRKYRGW